MPLQIVDLNLTILTLRIDATMLVHSTDLEPCRKPACTGADMQTTQDSLSSSKAPPATALDGWLPPGDAAKGFGGRKVPPEGLVSRPVELAMAGGAAASCPVAQEGIGGAETAPPLLGVNELPAGRKQANQQDAMTSALTTNTVQEQLVSRKMRLKLVILQTLQM